MKLKETILNTRITGIHPPHEQVTRNIIRQTKKEIADIAEKWEFDKNRSIEKLKGIIRRLYLNQNGTKK